VEVVAHPAQPDKVRDVEVLAEHGKHWRWQLQPSQTPVRIHPLFAVFYEPATGAHGTQQLSAARSLFKVQDEALQGNHALPASPTVAFDAKNQEPLRRVAKRDTWAPSGSTRKR